MKFLVLITLAWTQQYSGQVLSYDTSQGYLDLPLVKEYGCTYLHSEKYDSRWKDEYSNDGFYYHLFYHCPKALPKYIKIIKDTDLEG